MITQICPGGVVMKDYSCDFCGADREYHKQCPKCFSKKRPSEKDSQNLNNTEKKDA